MIKKLKRKFILLSMLSLLALLIVIILGMNLLNYVSFVNETDQLLETISREGGKFPDMEHGNFDGLPGFIAPKTPDETGYFSVVLDKNNDIVQIDLSKADTISAQYAKAYAAYALEKGEERGFADQFRYIIVADDYGTRITFLDCGIKLDALYGFALSSVLVSLIGYIIIFVIVVFLAGRIIRPVAESYEKQKRFITDAGHEIKTPLTIINANADLCEMEQGENEYLTEIKQQTKRLTELTGSLVYLAKMEEKESSLQMIDFPVSDVIAETAASFNALAQLQGKNFLCDIEPMLSMKGNAASLRQLTSILLDNALKYSPQGATVSITLKKQSKSLCLTVFNTTSAEIPQGDISQIFERFYRLDPSRNSQTGGHGIGLSIAKAIADAHGGRIRAKSDNAHSLSITATLPM